MERIQTRQQAAKAKKVSDDAIEQVFAYWKQVISPKSKAVLDHKRKLRIGWAIHDYGVESCKKAVDGITKSPWHMGDNPQRKKYNDVELIFRDADNVEKFIGMAEERDARAEFLADPNW